VLNDILKVGKIPWFDTTFNNQPSFNCRASVSLAVDLKKLRLLLFIFAGLTLLSTISVSAETFSRMRPMLGTYVEISIHGSDRAKAYKTIDEGFSAIDELDHLLSSHRIDSELNAINQAAGKTAISVSPWTYECVAAAVEIGDQTKGAFDITCRPILELWGFVQKKYHFPEQMEIDGVLPFVNYQNILLLESKGLPLSLGRYRIGLLRSHMQIDVGGIGKGYAVDKAVEALERIGVQSGLVRAGGDLRAFGPEEWDIGIADPSNPEKAVRKFKLRNAAVSTSGNYQNYFVMRGKRYAHIIDPRNGWPVQHHRSLSVQAPTCMLSDAWSTALFVNPKLNHSKSIQVLDVE
jgi:FAD:protein FMN transferase